MTKHGKQPLTLLMNQHNHYLITIGEILCVYITDE